MGPHQLGVDRSPVGLERGAEHRVAILERGSLHGIHRCRCSEGSGVELGKVEGGERDQAHGSTKRPGPEVDGLSNPRSGQWRIRRGPHCLPAWLVTLCRPAGRR
jgi:hypothetical protein